MSEQEPATGTASEASFSSSSSVSESTLQKKVKQNKMADQPHWWTMILSIAAILISIFSYTESRRNRVLNEKLNRPIVRVISVSETGPVMEHGEKTLITNRLTVRNSGRTFAKNVRIELRSQLDDIRVGGSFRRFADTEDVMSAQSPLGDLAPEDEETVAFMANVLSKPPMDKLGSVEFSLVVLKAQGTLTYEDPLTGQTYRESLCYVLHPESRGFSRC